MLCRLSFFALAIIASANLADAKDAPHVDETALRYYASVGQKDRIIAEANRLSHLDPNWKMPEDLYTQAAPRDDEGPLWQFYKDGKFDDLAKAIAARQAVEPDWKPSDNLLTKIKTKQLRITIMQFAKTGQWRAIVQSLGDMGTGWAKDDAEVLWAIAEAYARGNDSDKAYDIYHAILEERTDQNERDATIEYAIPLIPMRMTEKLISMGHVDAAAKSEFDSIGIDITRARISAFLHDEPAHDISDAELKSFEHFVHAGTNANEYGLLAWYQFKCHDYPNALSWFKLAISHNGDASIAHGLAHTLRKLDRRRDAEEIAYAWRQPLINNSILFIDLLETDLTRERPPVIEPERLARYAHVTMDTESGEGAQALAWYAYNTCQYPLALQWFERATAWLPKEATVYGYALALQRLHRTKDFRDVVNRYDGLFPKVVALAFDDGIRKPPPQCESNFALSAAQREPVPGGSSGLDWNGRTMADTLRLQTERAPIVMRVSMPSPDMANGSSSFLPPFRKKTDFPISISPENPLRFSALKSIATGDLRNQSQGSWPLVAHRVTGVGPMPYERYGFSLLPGWDGTKEAGSPLAMEETAPAGTLWASEYQSADSHQVSSELVGPGSRFPAAKANEEHAR